MSGPDLVCIGRTSVDLYAEQDGSKLEDVQSFRKYVGGSATNIAVGTAKLGVKSAMLTRVGEEQMGRFVLKTLAENGVDVSQVRYDPGKLTPYVLLAVRAIDDFPRLFAYGDAADLAIEEEDVDPGFIGSSKALLVTGTPLSRPGARAATVKAIRAARDAGARVVFDLDYRPVFWGVASHEQGGEMFVASEEVTAVYRSVLPDCDLVVGTEEEIRIAGGSTETREALLGIRGISGATVVLKVGAMGAIVFPGDIPDDLEDGVRVPGFPVEVFNSVGAGDAFMSGFLSGWLREEALEECLRLGNACGAIVVSRHGCSPAMPTRAELEYFLGLEEKPRRLRDDAWLEHLHRATTRDDPEELRILAVDHRWQLEEAADELGVDRGRLRELKVLLGRAFRRVAEEDEAAGVLIDDIYGDKALEELTGSGAWISRAVEVAKSRPVQFVGGPNLAATLRHWPEEHVVKCNLYMHPEDDDETREIQEQRVFQLYDACLVNDRHLLLEVQPSPGTTYDADSVARLIGRFYEIGVRPEWWKIPPNPDPAVWARIGGVVREHDPYCAGLLVLGQAAGEEELAESFAAAASEPLCRGFAIGRSIYGEPGRRWLAGEIDDEELVSSVAERYGRMNVLWQNRNAQHAREGAAMTAAPGKHTEQKGEDVQNAEARGGDERIPVGVVGSGGMGGMHAHCLHRKVAGARVAAVSDIDTGRAGKVAGECGGAAVFGDAVEMIRDGSVEAVVIASPDPTHAELVHECLRLGKPVLCEKPLATSPEEALGIVEAETEVGRKLVQVGFMRRYDPQHVDVKNVVLSGAIGEPILFKGWHRNAQIPPGVDSEWVVINAAIHDLDSARWMLETEVGEVFVRGLNTAGSSGDEFDLQLIQLTFADGRLATIEVNVDAQFGYEVGVEVVGVNGTAHTAPPSGALVRLDRSFSQNVDGDWLDRFEPAYTIELQEWVESIMGGRPPAPDAWDGYASLVVAEACIASIRSGNPKGVTVPEKPALYEKEGSVAR